MHVNPEDLDDFYREQARRRRVCPECGVKGAHIPNCPNDPENEITEETEEE
jgi:hypothetical protein